MNPIAKKTDLITQPVGDEMLVYDGRDESARRLNQLSTVVWRHCTGENTVAQIAVLVAAEMELPTDVEPLIVVERALEELAENGLLLDTGLAGTAASGDVGRRDIVRVLAAIPLFPSIDKIFAPTMANAGSLPPDTSATATTSPTSSTTASTSLTSSVSLTPSTSMIAPTPTPTP